MALLGSKASLKSCCKAAVFLALDNQSQFHGRLDRQLDLVGEEIVRPSSRTLPNLEYFLGDIAQVDSNTGDGEDILRWFSRVRRF